MPKREQHRAAAPRSTIEPQRVVDGGPDLRVVPEQVAVVREPDPARRREQVVAREATARRSSRAGSRRRPRSRRARAPGRRARSARRRHVGAAPGSSAVGRDRGGHRLGRGRRDVSGHRRRRTASSWRRSACRPRRGRRAGRFTFPACHLARKLVKVSRCAEPSGVTGIVADRGFTKIFVNVAKFGSGLSSFDLRRGRCRGTLRIPFENFASACVFVVRYLTSFQASSLVLAALRDADDRPVDVPGAVEALVAGRASARSRTRGPCGPPRGTRRATRRRSSSRASRGRTRAAPTTRHRHPSATSRACRGRSSRRGSSASEAAAASPGPSRAPTCPAGSKYLAPTSGW